MLRAVCHVKHFNLLARCVHFIDNDIRGLDELARSNIEAGSSHVLKTRVASLPMR
jgi:hypothetical protein